MFHFTDAHDKLNLMKINVKKLIGKKLYYLCELVLTLDVSIKDALKNVFIFDTTHKTVEYVSKRNGIRINGGFKIWKV